MSVTLEDETFDILPHPTYSIKIERHAPKITFQAVKGYKHQRESFNVHRKNYGVEYAVINQYQLNTLENFLDNVGSNAFWWLAPEMLWKNPDNPGIRLMRIVSETIQYNVLLSKDAGGPYYTVQFQIEEV